jgi:hypothetical protein
MALDLRRVGCCGLHHLRSVCLLCYNGARRVLQRGGNTLAWQDEPEAREVLPSQCSLIRPRLQQQLSLSGSVWDITIENCPEYLGCTMGTSYIGPLCVSC